MDFGVLDGLVSSSENNKNSVISCGDSDLKTKCFGSEGEWRDLKMAKISEDDNLKTMLLQQQQRSNGGAYNTSMLSFSSPKAHSVAFPYYARNNTGYSAGAGAAGPFTPSQWMELEHQALIYKYITANAAIPSNLLIPIKKAFESAAYSGANLRQNPYGWGALRLGFYNSSDPEPGRCRRTDGKKWRCAKHAAIDQKYCERHMNRGRHRSRKHVEAQTCHSVTSAAKKTTVATVISQAKTQNTAASIQDSRPMLSSFVPLEKNQPSALEEESHASEFGFVGSDSLLNPMHKSESKSQSSLHQFMEDWPHCTRAPASERLDLSPLRIGKNTNRVPGGPLGEVLQHSTNNPSGLNM